MHMPKRLSLLTCFLFTLTTAAQDIPAHDTITLQPRQ